MVLSRPTDQELATIIREVIANAREREQKYLPRATPLSPPQKTALQGFFSDRVLDQVRVLELKDEHVPNPTYQKRAQMRYRMMLDFQHMAEITHPRLIILQEKPTLRLLFHAMVHVAQYAALGLESYLELYVRAFVQTGNYASVPLEVQAFRLDQRYTENPRAVFSVENEISRWTEAGDYVLKTRPWSKPAS